MWSCGCVQFAYLRLNVHSLICRSGEFVQDHGFVTFPMRFINSDSISAEMLDAVSTLDRRRQQFHIITPSHTVSNSGRKWNHYSTPVCILFLFLFIMNNETEHHQYHLMDENNNIIIKVFIIISLSLCVLLSPYLPQQGSATRPAKISVLIVVSRINSRKGRSAMNTSRFGLRERPANRIAVVAAASLPSSLTCK